MALRVVTVKSAGGDYSSLNAALVGEVNDLVSLDRQLEIDCYNFVDTTAADTGAGWTTDATHTVLVTAVDDHAGIFGGSGGTSAYSMATSDNCINAQIEHAVYRGLSLGATSGNRGGRVVALSTWERCIALPIPSTDTLAAAFLVLASADGTHFESCVGAGDVVFNLLGPATFSLYDCTAVSSNFSCYKAASSTVIVKNCIGSGGSIATFDVGSGSFDAACATCASDDASAASLPGTGHRSSQTFTFLNAAARDYHLAPTDTGALGFGTDLSADSDFPITVDVDNVLTGTPWNIGADQPAFVYPVTNDVYLREVPSDANSNDVRLYPFEADESVTITGTAEGSSEVSADAVGAERFVATVTGSSEDSASASGAERLAATVTGSSEDSSAASGAERFGATVTGSSEDSSAVAGAERFAATVEGSSEDSADAVGSEHITGTVGGSSEGYGDAVGAADLAGTISGSSEASCAAVGAVRIAGTVEGSGETSCAAVGGTPVPEVADVRGGGQWRDPWNQRPTTLLHAKVSGGSDTGCSAVGAVRYPATISVGGAAGCTAVGTMRIPGRVRCGSSASGEVAGQVTQLWEIEDEALILAAVAFGFDEDDSVSLMELV